MTRQQTAHDDWSDAGGAVTYQGINSLGYVAEQTYRGPVKLSKAKAGAAMVVLGAGLAGMVAAMELRNAGYRVDVLEFQLRSAGALLDAVCGDSFKDLNGTTQSAGFAKGTCSSSASKRGPICRPVPHSWPRP